MKKLPLILIIAITMVGCFETKSTTEDDEVAQLKLKQSIQELQQFRKKVQEITLDAEVNLTKSQEMMKEGPNRFGDLSKQMDALSSSCENKITEECEKYNVAVQELKEAMIAQALKAKELNQDIKKDLEVGL